MLLNLPPLVRGAVAMLPPVAVLLVAYRRYDGAFDDRWLLVYALAGLALGVLVAVFERLSLWTQGEALVFLLGSPLVAQLGKAAGLNLRRWQGKPLAVFHGGAMGAGAGAMVVLVYAQALVPSGAELWWLALVILALGAGVSLTHYATGLLIGLGVARGRALRSAVPAVLAMIPMAALVYEYVRGRYAIWAGVALVYGVVAAALASRYVLPEGLTEEGRRTLRRRVRRARRGGDAT